MRDDRALIIGPHHPFCCLLRESTWDDLFGVRCTCRGINIEYQYPVIMDVCFQKHWISYWPDGSIMSIYRAKNWPHIVEPYISHWNYAVNTIGVNRP